MKSRTARFIIGLIFSLIWISGFVNGEVTQEENDEIIRLQREIAELKRVVLLLVNSLPEDKKKEFKAIIDKLEKELEEKEDKHRQEKYSTTTREVNKLKQHIEKVKENLETLSGGIAFSGFFDVTASTYKNNPNIFALGNFELDMEKSFGKNFQVAAALVFNNDGAELGVGFIDFHLFGGPIAARGRLFSEKGLHFQVGRFDIPFGNDWQYFASTDRISVSPPLPTELIMNGGYNDVGIRILRAAITYNYSLFMLNGTEEGFSFGGRFGFTPFNNPFTFKKKQIQALELGISYIHDFNRGGKREEKLLAFDFESEIGPVRFQGEYIRKNYDIEETRFDGFHISGFVDLSKFGKLPVTLYGRYDFYKGKPYNFTMSRETNRLERLTAGLNINLFGISNLKLEFLDYIAQNEEFYGSSFYAQLVIIF